MTERESREKFEAKFSTANNDLNRINFRRDALGGYAENRIDALWEGWQAALASRDAEVANLKSVMIAAAEEIHAHWDAHCDAEGYGPQNLMHRLEAGIPSEYAYKAGDFERMRSEIAKLREDAQRQNKLMHLASQDEVFFGGFLYDPDDRTFRCPPPVVLCNDFFAPAADCQELPVECIDELHAAYTRFGHAGVLAWVSLRRGGANPWRIKEGLEYRVEFEKARASIDQEQGT